MYMVSRPSMEQNQDIKTRKNKIPKQMLFIKGVHEYNKSINSSIKIK